MPDANLISNPFSALPLIAAPAILTNAASVLAMSTGTRFARATDRMRVLVARLDEPSGPADTRALLARQVMRVQRQAMLLLHGLGGAYVALAAFAIASLISIVGAGVDARGLHGAARLSVVLGLVAGVIGAAGLVYGCFMLFGATRLSMQNIVEEAAHLQTRRLDQTAVAPL